MMLTGYCTECHRVRPVRVSGQGMAMLAAKRVATGTCQACIDKEDERRQQQRRQR